MRKRYLLLVLFLALLGAAYLRGTFLLFRLFPSLPPPPERPSANPGLALPEVIEAPSSPVDGLFFQGHRLVRVALGGTVVYERRGGAWIDTGEHPPVSDFCASAPCVPGSTEMPQGISLRSGTYFVSHQESPKALLAFVSTAGPMASVSFDLYFKNPEGTLRRWGRVPLPYNGSPCGYHPAIASAAGDDEIAINVCDKIYVFPFSASGGPGYHATPEGTLSAEAGRLRGADSAWKKELARACPWDGRDRARGEAQQACYARYALERNNFKVCELVTPFSETNCWNLFFQAQKSPAVCKRLLEERNPLARECYGYFRGTTEFQAVCEQQRRSDPGPALKIPGCDSP